MTCKWIFFKGGNCRGHLRQPRMNPWPKIGYPCCRKVFRRFLWWVFDELASTKLIKSMTPGLQFTAITSKQTEHENNSLFRKPFWSTSNNIQEFVFFNSISQYPYFVGKSGNFQKIETAFYHQFSAPGSPEYNCSQRTSNITII